MVRIHGHSSAYTAYECLHQPTYSSVFNITNNFGCASGCGCGGGIGGGFWNSFAYGLGNSLSGLFGGFGGMFGGMFGMGNMFGMGGFGMFPMFGMGNMFGMGGFNPWGALFGGSRTTKPATASTVTCNCGCNGSGNGNVKLDADNPKIEAFSKRLDTNYKDKGKKLNQTDYNNEIAALKKLARELDGVQDSSNKQWIKDLLDKLNGLDAEDGVNKITDINEIIGSTPGEEPAVDTTELDSNWENISTTPALSEDDKRKLQTWGVKPVNIGTAAAPKWCVTLPSSLDNIEAIKFLADKGLNVAVAHNSHNNAKTDPWIAGKISVPSDFSADNYSFTIDCDGVGLYKNIYEVTKNSDPAYPYNVKLKTARTAGYTLKAGANFSFNSSTKSLERNSADVLFSTQNKSSNNKYKHVTTT